MQLLILFIHVENELNDIVKKTRINGRNDCCNFDSQISAVLSPFFLLFFFLSPLSPPLSSPDSQSIIRGATGGGGGGGGGRDGEGGGGNRGERGGVCHFTSRSWAGVL